MPKLLTAVIKFACRLAITSSFGPRRAKLWAKSWQIWTPLQPAPWGGRQRSGTWEQSSIQQKPSKLWHKELGRDSQPHDNVILEIKIIQWFKLPICWAKKLKKMPILLDKLKPLEVQELVGWCESRTWGWCESRTVQENTEELQPGSLSGWFDINYLVTVFLSKLYIYKYIFIYYDMKFDVPSCQRT